MPEVSVEELESSAEEGAIPEVNSNLTADGKLAASFEPCISISKPDLRKSWIKDNINPAVLDTVDFCSACCGMLSQPANNGECMTGCQSAITAAPAAGDLFDKCLAGDQSLAIVEQMTECKLCVDDTKTKHPEVEDNVFIIKKQECDTKFKGCDNPLNCTGSMAQDAEEERY